MVAHHFLDLEYYSGSIIGARLYFKQKQKYKKNELESILEMDLGPLVGSSYETGIHPSFQNRV